MIVYPKKKKPRKLQKGLLEPVSEFIRSQMNTQKSIVCLGNSNDQMSNKIIIIPFTISLKN